jgi:hypothetical protein
VSLTWCERSSSRSCSKVLPTVKVNSDFHTVTTTFLGAIGENRLTVERGRAVDKSFVLYCVYMREAQLYVKHPVCLPSGDLHCYSAFRGYTV